MRIGRLFAMSMLSVTAPPVILGAEVVVPQAGTVSSKSEAINAVEAFSAVLGIGQQLAALRAPYVVPLLQDMSATPAQLDQAVSCERCPARISSPSSKVSQPEASTSTCSSAAQPSWRDRPPEVGLT
ncbi:hypothetical protein [Bradyrhizobium ivorense]|uniref:hypothetical protein n=1 Tax=Bradyrhizobium ivorense TaxID=2511166 RepID=UPI00112213C3|nr:hypothetical protein [Bradyrhizobium ivorense]